MNDDEREYLLGDMISEMKHKSFDELKTMLWMSRVIGGIVNTAGVILILLFLMVPTLGIFIFSTVIVWFSLNLAVVIGVLKPAIKTAIKAKTEDK